MKKAKGKSKGANFFSNDIIFTFLVIGIFVVIIIVTIACHSQCRRRRNKGVKAKSLTICCCYDNKVNSRLRVVRQKMGSDCAICLEENNMMIRPVVELTCKHVYHKDCISKCLEMDKRAKCPQCRRQPGQFSTTDRFIANIMTVVRMRNERTIETKASKYQQAEEKGKMVSEYTDIPKCSGRTILVESIV
ncbi:uncharacterized protein LOC132548212 [Ylistrum balloti]|uniref:uncharacterized protein LOC132548212 n=1 Tax=Ylistrum balloti TaxID=509963 RepID=UPI00290588E7|nr:uncharacterized protein LOC132548212 [Ylistrum balloti]